MKKIIAIILPFILLFSLVACAADESENEPQETEPVTTPDSGSDTILPVQPSGDQFRVAFSLPPIRNFFNARMRFVIDEAIAEAATSHPNFKFTAINGVDENDQLSQLEIFMNGDYDLIAIMPGDADMIAPVAEQIYNNGTPLIIINHRLPTDIPYTHFIDGDNIDGGRVAAEFLGEALGGEGQIISLNMGTGTPIAEARQAGFMDVLTRDFPNIEMMAELDSAPNRESGLESMANALRAHPHIDAVFTHSDDIALGVIAAIEHTGRTDIQIITGFGGSLVVFDEYMKNDSNFLLKGSSLYSPMMGYDAVWLAIDVLLGQGNWPKDIILPSVFVTAENIDQYYEFGF